jgi:hypothetical protein
MKRQELNVQPYISMQMVYRIEIAALKTLHYKHTAGGRNTRGMWLRADSGVLCLVP